MFATTGYVQGNVVLASDNSLEKFNDKKVIIAVLDEEKNPTYTFASDDEVQKISDTLIKQNLEAYRELAK
ncbi:hypothetical protein [uncultured Treponema sp.]|uniref:hypothetical protein n=1 Tax=uncultured Treponema sp. TaxID=162155 RepID=UPI0025F269EB|nr:hypothetical protein [uncultured Treponema sp.]